MYIILKHTAISMDAHYKRSEINISHTPSTMLA